MPDPHDVSSETRTIGYEVRDTNIVAIVTFIVGLFLTLAFTQIGVWMFLKAISADKPTTAMELLPRAAALRQRQRLSAEEDAVLKDYGWAGGVADKKARPVRIPIDRAIELLSERGVPPTPDRPRSEIEVNSHSGTPAPETKGAAGKEAKP